MTTTLAKIIAFFTALNLFIGAMFGVGGKKVNKETFNTAKNVIFMIGDGMGFNSIEKAKKETGIKTLGFDNFPMHGESMTASSSSMVTDSAAGATALACGVRTTNRYIGTYNTDASAKKSHPKSLSELAQEQGKMTGIVTTDKTTGATPGGFSAHTSDRDNEKDITNQQLASKFDLIWGTKTESGNKTVANENGFTYVYDAASMNSLTEGSRSFGQFSDELWHQKQTNGMPTLAEMTSKAIDLLDDDEDGFFLMVEGAHIDKNNHSNNGEGMKDALLSFSDTLNVALEYAKTHEDTLVVVTADHETGGITLINDEYVYTTGNHTGVNVPICAYGVNGIVGKDEKMQNIELSRRVAYAMGQEQWPVKVK